VNALLQASGSISAFPIHIAVRWGQITSRDQLSTRDVHDSIDLPVICFREREGAVFPMYAGRKQTPVKKVNAYHVNGLKCSEGQLILKFSCRGWEKSNQLVFQNYHQVSHCHKHQKER
jgi:hypothetical protein